ncbi:uncharacterized protein MELLADRAFT_65520 [Melampsora larici-populina 98AG31]|uniref:Uncharacterized protein n=1 Tax=Melampsora larici-populina (strain 98AG31 / pathotype 3-4-7) TaxID=747676 RepID=F4RVQ7_MELLP|nr:uncharacterized protein MELLADRAFT_65520 [Melampsora larici-populina 98AG31]EGG03402.1 hypothetical protein MELLADRAFT_65520 [Melampsora larici-populina 98AG31]
MSNIKFLTIACIVFSVVYSRFDGRLFLQDKTIDRIQATQVFKPMNPNFQYRSESLLNAEVEVIQTERIEFMKRKLKNFSSFQMAVHYMQKGPFEMFFHQFVTALGKIQKALKSGEPNQQLEYQTISELLRYLQRDDLKDNLRFVCLSVLRIFLEYLPMSFLKSMRTDINQGPLCRAALELSLTKGFKGMKPIFKAAKTHVFREDYPDQLEANEFQSSNSIIKLHDELIQESFSLERNAIDMTKVCIEFMKEPLETQNHKEWQNHYMILTHLVKFSTASRRYLKEKSTGNPLLQELFQRILRWKDIRPVIDSFLLMNDADPYIASLLLPFGKYKPVTLDHYEYIIKVLEFQVQAKEEAQLKSQVQKETHPHDELKEDPLRHYLPETKEIEKFEDHKSFVINIFYDASAEIPGAKALLDRKLELKGNSGFDP